MSRNRNMTKRTAENDRPQRRRVVAPPVDIYENQDEFLILADLPGVADDQVNVSCDADQLTITGKRIAQPEAEVLSREHAGFDYSRTFTVPSGIDLDKVKARFEEGLLYVHLPKGEAIKPRQIQVQAG